MTDPILRAECADLFIGQYLFDALRVIDTGEFRMSQKQILEPIALPKNWISRLPYHNKNQLKELMDKGFSGYLVRVAYTKNRKASRASTLNLKDVRIIWRFFDRIGNVKAQQFIDCLTEDSLQDRFEQVYECRRSIDQRRVDDFRLLDVPSPGEPIFEDWFESMVAKLTGLHKNHIRNGLFYWKFVYCWLTPEERAHLEKINPVIKSTGRRRYKIHDCLTPETKERLKPYQLKLAGKMESCNSMAELERMFNRVRGFDQGGLFDGWDM